VASLRADAEAVANQQHADDQLGINRGPVCRAVEAGQMLTQFEAVDVPQQVIAGPMVFEPERVEQPLLHHETFAHHDPADPVTIKICS
jgi:type IV secretory pathway VirJ component